MRKIAEDGYCEEGKGLMEKYFNLGAGKKGYCRGRRIEEETGEINRDKILYIFLGVI